MKVKLLFLLIVMSGLFSKAQTSTGNLTVSPNPMYEETVITFTASTGDTISIKVAEVTGNIILTPRTNAVLPTGVYHDSINLINYPAGVYYVMATFGYGRHTVAKIVKQGAVGIPLIDESSPIHIFPNPVGNELHIELNSMAIAGIEQAARFNALLYDVTGREIRRWPLRDNQNIVDTKDLHNGLYVLKLEDVKSGRQFQVKVIKE